MRFIDILGNEYDFAKDQFNYVIYDTDSVTLLRNIFTTSSYGYRDSQKARLIRSIEESKVSHSDLRNIFFKTNLESDPSFVKSDSYFVNLIDSINSIPKSLFRKKDNDIVYIPNNSILNVITEDLKPQGGTIAPKSVHGMWGFVNSADEWIIPAMYDYTELRKNSGYNSLRRDYISTLHYVHGREGWGAIDSIGNTFIRPTYDSIQPLSAYATKRYYFLVTKEGNHGIINEEGKVTLPANEFRRNIKFFPEINRMLYSNKMGEGIIADSIGQFICAIDRVIQWEELSPMSINEKAIKTGNWGFIGAVDWHGNEIVPHIYDFIYMDDEFITVRTNARYEGAYSHMGDNIIPVRFKNHAISSIGMLISVEHDNSYDVQVFDLNGNPVIYDN